jgi:hypothetical protein
MSVSPRGSGAILMNVLGVPTLRDRVLVAPAGTVTSVALWVGVLEADAPLGAVALLELLA